MRRVQVILLATLLSGCAHVPLGEHLIVQDKRFGKMEHWQILSYENFRDGGGVRYFVPPGRANLKNWHELVTLGTLVKPKTPLDKYVEASTGLYEAQCPGTAHEVIEANEYSVYYTNAYPACGGRPAQFEITRMMKGNEDIFRVSYTVKGRELDKEEREEWLSILRSAYVAIGDQHERIR